MSLGTTTAGTRGTSRLALALAALCMALGVTAMAGMAGSPAGAMSAGDASPALAADAAPNCLVADPIYAKSVYVSNDCGYTLRAKLIIAWGRDGGCYTYHPGDYIRWTWSTGSFDGLDSC